MEMNIGPLDQRNVLIDVDQAVGDLVKSCEQDGGQMGEFDFEVSSSW